MGHKSAPGSAAGAHAMKTAWTVGRNAQDKTSSIELRNGLTAIGACEDVNRYEG